MFTQVNVQTTMIDEQTIEDTNSDAEEVGLESVDGDFD